MERNQGTHTLAAKAVNLDEQNQVVMTQSLGKRYLAMTAQNLSWYALKPTETIQTGLCLPQKAKILSAQTPAAKATSLNM
jgi:hypothetical protein